MKIPHKLQPVLWSTNVDLLDSEKDKEYIIHQLLIYGTFEDLKWLFDTYTKKELINVFIHNPYKNYPRNVFYFVKNYILDCENSDLDEDNYVTSIHGPVRPRASNRFSKT